MPYKDAEKQREFSRTWAKRNPAAAANTPLAREVEQVIVAAGKPMSPAAIMGALSRQTTPKTLGVTLGRLSKAGRVRSLGYGKWVAATEPSA